jgi:hypothetical protein
VFYSWNSYGLLFCSMYATYLAKHVFLRVLWLLLYSTCCDIEELCILPMQCIYVFYTILTAKYDSFPKLHQLISFCNGQSEIWPEFFVSQEMLLRRVGHESEAVLLQSGFSAVQANTHKCALLWPYLVVLMVGG